MSALHDPSPLSPTHVDVLIVGAGISGIGAGYHLGKQCPERSFVILEAKESFGGTWVTDKYPGARSDSDLYTFGYRFKPWTGAPIATADEIRTYMSEVIEENNLGHSIRYHHNITNAEWSSTDDLWTVFATDTAHDSQHTFTCNFLWMCQGYYRHTEGYTPQWPGVASFGGRIVHPQTWPDDLDLTDKQVVVIGSGATAATLVPAIADTCKHVTMLQRSPTYFRAARNANDLADQLREIEIDESWIHEIVRRKLLLDGNNMTKLVLQFPEEAKAELLKGVQELLPDGYDMKHFTPKYDPWRQRLAFVPDGDLFAGIRSGKADVVTDEIETFTETGIRTASGQDLPADAVITATGFNMSILGDIAFVIDGVPLDLAKTVTYRGMMFTGVPNLLWVFGYFRASWTLRADLIGDFTCRLLRHMDQKGVHRVTPQLRAEDGDMKLLSWVDPEDFNPNYLTRSMHLLPQRGDKPEWQHTQDYWAEKDALPKVDLDDGCLVYE